MSERILTGSDLTPEVFAGIFPILLDGSCVYFRTDTINPMEAGLQPKDKNGQYIDIRQDNYQEKILDWMETWKNKSKYYPVVVDKENPSLTGVARCYFATHLPKNTEIKADKPLSTISPYQFLDI